MGGPGDRLLLPNGKGAPARTTFCIDIIILLSSDFLLRLVFFFVFNVNAKIISTKYSEKTKQNKNMKFKQFFNHEALKRTISSFRDF